MQKGGKTPGVFMEQKRKQCAWSKVNWRCKVRLESEAGIRSFRVFSAGQGKAFAFYSDEDTLKGFKQRSDVQYIF